MTNNFNTNPLLQSQHLIDDDSLDKLFRGTVVSLDANGVYIHRDGSITVEGPYPVIEGSTAIVGDEVVVGRLGTGYAIFGRILRSDLPARAIFFNVQAYGAVGDGVVNDTTAIQETENIASLTGGIVYFPPGTYLCHRLTKKSRTTWLGAGAKVSVLKLADSQNTALVRSDGFITTDASLGIYGFGFIGLGFDGNKAFQASNSDSGLIALYGRNWFMRDCKIWNGKTVNLYTNWGTSASAPGPDGLSMEASLDNVEVFGAASIGIFWGGPHDSYWHGVVSHENGDRGIEIGARGNALKATSCHSWGLSQTYGWYIGGSGVQCVNCEAEGASNKQVHIRANDISWIGGQVYAAGGATTGIEIANSAAGYNLNTKILNCTTAALLFTSDGGGKAEVVVYGTSGTTYTGTVHADSRLKIFCTGGQVPAAGHRKLLGPWYANNVSPSLTDVYFQINGGASGSSVHEIAMMRAGSITGIVIRTSENRSAGTFTAEVQKNGSKIGLAAVLDGSNITFRATTQAQGEDRFVVGDVISVVWTTASWGPATADITCTVEIDD